VNGPLGGIAIGYDYRLPANWLVGVEADIAAADVKQTDNYSDAAITLRLDYLATLRGRLGFAWDRNLGSGLIDYSQKMTMAAMQIADMNV